MIEILKSRDEWFPLIKKVENSDCYHTFDYHQLSRNEDEQPILIKYSEDNKTIALPLLIRKIPGSPYKDATSVYGYPGPVTHNISGNFDNTNFVKELCELFKAHNIISVFSRLNPFIPFQETVLKNLGEVQTSGKVINIDLTKDIDIQRQEYQKRLKTYVNMSRRHCSTRKASSQKDILEFIDLYYENMRRVQARESYFFDKEYFFDLLNTNDFDTEILLAVHNETKTTIGGAMFIKKNKIIQYHLSGASEKYLGLNPIKLLIDEMRIIATRENYTYFNLGGGVGSKEDSLFQFKSNFSKDFKSFEIWKYIVNEKIYDNLVKRKKDRACSYFSKNCPEYFPCYRCNIS